MAIKIKVDVLMQTYVNGVLGRGLHHAPNVDCIIYPIWTHIFSLAEQIEVREANNDKGMGNLLWFVYKGKRYALNYKHNQQHNGTIELRLGSYKGLLLQVFTNADMSNVNAIFERIFPEHFAKLRDGKVEAA